MSNILNSIEPIAYSDNFKVWIDRFNNIVTELKTTEFAIDDEYVNVVLAQSITGAKTFNNTTVFNAAVTLSGDLNQNNLINGDIALERLNFKYGIDGNINFIGENGINLLSNPTANEFSLSFPTASTSNTLILDYAVSGGIFRIANNVNLEVANSQIKFGTNNIWNFPSLPGGTSYLTSSGGTISWVTDQNLAEEIALHVQDALLTVTPTKEILPIGTIIDIDTTKAEEWEAEGTPGGIAYGHIPDDTNFYGWLILNGGTITATNANSPFLNLIYLLNNVVTPPIPPTFPISATLSPNSTSGSPNTVKLIKFLADPVSTFGLTKGNGISFFESNGTTPKTNSSLTNGITQIGLNADTNVFQFNTDTKKLELKTNIPRYTNNRLTTATPVDDTDAANKLYVDTRVLAGGVEGSCYDLMQSVDGSGYSDAKNSFSIVDKSGAGRAWRTVATATLASGSIDSDVTLNAISPFGSNFGKVTSLKSTFATPDQFFFTDHNDVIYGYGENKRGDIAANSRGLTEFSSYYNSAFFPTNPYSNTTQIRQLLPAFLPLQASWPANAVLVDSVTGIAGSDDENTNITIKTKDGYGNAYVNINPSSGLVNYFNGTVPYTRGYYISAGRNAEGQFGRGNTTPTSATTGPLVWGPGFDSPGRNLWYNFALTSAEKTAIKASTSALSTLLASESGEKIRKRFNWFKPNAITAGGLATTENDAIAAWRTQTGLSTESFSDYNWYIKKVVRTYDAHYVIVGKPGNEADNEIWCAGINRKGAFGNLTTGSITDFVPMLSDQSSNNATSTFRVLNATLPTQSGTIFERTPVNGQVPPHGLSDFDVLTFKTTNRYIILGDASGANRSTQFRLFSTLEDGARLAFISNSTEKIVSLKNNTTDGIGALNTYRGRLKGIVDISVSRGGAAVASGDGIILRKGFTFTSPLPTGLLDRLPESDILTDKLLVGGLNTNGRLAINNLDNPTLPRAAAFAGSGLESNKISKIQTCNYSAISFLLSSNGVLYFAGNRASGCANSGSASAGNTLVWTNVGLQGRVHDFFIIDDANLTRIFVITETATNSGIFEIYAGGVNTGYVLGTSVSLNAATPKYAKLIFPENPDNIVNIAGAMNQTYILCKDEGEDIGRVYVTGTEVTRSYFPVSTVLKTFPQFKKIDRDIL
jgi:hypothetical protein